MSTIKQSDLPLISIITVVLNGEKTIERTIKSVIQQSYGNWEYIIIDGESSDRTPEIIAKYRDRISHYLREKDLGIYDAMNKGIKLASGEVIGILNSGDWYTQNSLETVSQMAKCQQSQIISGAMIRFDEQKDITFKLNKTHQDLAQHIHQGMPINHPATFVSKNTYKKLGLFNLNYQICGDYDFIYRAYYSEEIEFDFTPEVLAHMSLGGVSEKLSSLLIRCKEHYQIEKGSVTLPLNLMRRIIWLVANLFKHFIRNNLNSKLMMHYYQLRHGI